MCISVSMTVYMSLGARVGVGYRLRNRGVGVGVWPCVLYWRRQRLKEEGAKGVHGA